MPILTDNQSIFVYDHREFLTRRDTNTVSVELNADAVFAVICDLASAMARGGPIYLVVESDKVYTKDMD